MHLVLVVDNGPVTIEVGRTRKSQDKKRKKEQDKKKRQADNNYVLSKLRLGSKYSGRGGDYVTD